MGIIEEQSRTIALLTLRIEANERRIERLEKSNAPLKKHYKVKELATYFGCGVKTMQTKLNGWRADGSVKAYPLNAGIPNSPLLYDLGEVENLWHQQSPACSA